MESRCVGRNSTAIDHDHWHRSRKTVTEHNNQITWYRFNMWWQRGQQKENRRQFYYKINNLMWIVMVIRAALDVDIAIGGRTSNVSAHYTKNIPNWITFIIIVVIFRYKMLTIDEIHAHRKSIHIGKWIKLKSLARWNNASANTWSNHVIHRHQKENAEK